MQDNNVQINKEKSLLNKGSVEYLGYHISGEGIKPYPNKLKSIRDAPPPTTTTELQKFVGLISYYGKFIMNFST